MDLCSTARGRHWFVRPCHALLHPIQVIRMLSFVPLRRDVESSLLFQAPTRTNVGQIFTPSLPTPAIHNSPAPSFLSVVFMCQSDVLGERDVDDVARIRPFGDESTGLSRSPLSNAVCRCFQHGNGGRRGRIRGMPSKMWYSLLCHHR